eukprot:9404159-Pyramimonas_sp.AAC.1
MGSPSPPKPVRSQLLRARAETGRQFAWPKNVHEPVEQIARFHEAGLLRVAHVRDVVRQCPVSLRRGPEGLLGTLCPH